MHVRELAGEDQGNDGHQFDEYVQGRAWGVFERVADSIAYHCSLVDLWAFQYPWAVLLEHGPALYVLLGVVPGAAGVGCRDGHLYPADDWAGQEAGKYDWTKDETEGKGREDDLSLLWITSIPGAIISLSEARVEIRMQAL